ncbi:MAG: cupin domain-containing protein [Gemmatimonadota bacterium]|nr:cupin domain-containing protein [Gemmatimonadota bacterium]
MIVVRNWRDQIPYIGHISAIIWPLFRGSKSGNPPEMVQLQAMNSFVKHGLQGRQNSDHHHHDNIEQIYYILKGNGQMLLGEEIHEIREGDAVYVPVNMPHQAFNYGDDWMEHLIVSCPLPEIKEGLPFIRNWRDLRATVGASHSESWPLLRRLDETTTEEGGVLRRMHGMTRHALQGKQTTVELQSNGVEQVYFVISGRGAVSFSGIHEPVMEGSALYVPPGTPYSLTNKDNTSMVYVIFAAAVEQ